MSTSAMAPVEMLVSIHCEPSSDTQPILQSSLKLFRDGNNNVTDNLRLYLRLTIDQWFDEILQDKRAEKSLADMWNPKGCTETASMWASILAVRLEFEKDG